MNNLNDSNILQNALVGVEFEFYSNVEIKETAKQLADLIGKKIRVETKAHSDFEVTSDEFKIEPDMSGGAKINGTSYWSTSIFCCKINDY